MSEAYIFRAFRKFQNAGTVKMAQFFIINGITDPGLHHQIAQYAFLEGVESCDLYEYLHGTFHKEMEPLFFCLDQDGFRNLPEQLLNILYMRCQLVAIPGCREEAEDLRRKEKYGCALMKTPFSRQDFRRMCIQYAGVKKWEDRTMRFENLTIDRISRQVRLDGKCVEMGAYDYDILLLLAEHMGDVVTRDLLSRALPRRRRVSQRNIDSHIKSLRKCLGREECIQCIRSVGYCLSEKNVLQQEA